MFDFIDMPDGASGEVSNDSIDTGFEDTTLTGAEESSASRIFGIDEGDTGSFTGNDEGLESRNILSDQDEEPVNLLSENMNPSPEQTEENHGDDISFKGYSSCHSCSCRGFTGSGYCCDNCGHNYDAHY